MNPVEVRPGRARSSALRAASAVLFSAACFVKTASGVSPDPLILAEFVGERVALRDARPSPVGGANEFVAAWLIENGDMLVGSGAELRLTRVATIAAGRLLLFSYELDIEGLPVENAGARVAVSSDRGNEVVLATATRMHVPAESRPGVLREAEEAVQAATRLALNPVPGAVPTQCWWRDETSGAARRVWRISVLEMEGEMQTAFLDVATGDLVRLRDDVLHAGVDGFVFANATPGTLPDHLANPPAVVGVPVILVSTSAGDSTHTDSAGAYILPGQAPGTLVSSSLANGRFARVFNAAGVTLSGSAFLFPGQPANILLNPLTSEFLTAQVNAYRHAGLAHEFFRSRSDFSAIDVPVNINVNLEGLCNASFDGGALNFYRASSGCYNSAYSTIVAHEYGHFIVSQLGLAQGAFGEGFADALAMLLHETPTIGAEFYRGSAMRHPGYAGRQYPCSGGIHYCGEVLAGVWWGILQNLAASDGFAGRERARQLFVDWAQLTLGGGGANEAQSAHPLTALEILTVDDDDSDLLNGTPHYGSICAAFAAHGIACPDIAELRFSYPDGLPDWIPPATGRTIRFRVDAAQWHPMRNSGFLDYSVAPGFWLTLGATEVAPNEYVVELPALLCGQTIRFRAGARTQLGVPVFDPPAGAHATTAAQQSVSRFYDDFEMDRGWSPSAPGDTATFGRWERADPQPTAAQTGDDHSPLGITCWVTQAAAGSSTSSFDVDNGVTTLTSPMIDLSDAGDAVIGYWRWYSNHTTSPAPRADVFEIFATTDGVNWIRVESVGPDGPEVSGGWYNHAFRLSDFVPPSPTVQLRFVASDLGQSSTVEAALDDVHVLAFVCDGEGGCANPCREDIDFDCFVGMSDLALLLSHFGETVFGSNLDIQPNGRIDVGDLASLLSVFGTPCE